MASAERDLRGKQRLVLVLILAGIFKSASSETIETCISEDFEIACASEEVIFVKLAEYGRMKVGRCITKEDEFLGCKNDVLPLLDKWCSGRRDCSFRVSNKELDAANVNCLEILRQYLKVEYDCVDAGRKCSRTNPNKIDENQGSISSMTTDTQRCGTQKSPWIISAKPGQTIHLDMVDFGASSHSSNFLSCSTVYGFIIEKALGINHTICSGRQREVALYASKTNIIQLILLPREKRGESHFLIKYSIIGCAEPPHTVNMWYKREGSEAILGCENSEKEWRLTCKENKWQGEVGNCTKPASIAKPELQELDEIHISSIVIISGIAGIAIVFSVVAVVSGVVYINKYRMRQEVKRANLHKTYFTLERNTQTYYRPVTMDQSENCWDVSIATKSNPQMTSYLERSACPTLQLQNPSERIKSAAESSLETQSLYNSIKSN